MFAAFFTNAVKHHNVIAQLVTVLFGNGMLFSFDGRIGELHHFAAFHADKVVVMVAFFELVGRTIRIKVMMDDDPCLFELGQHTINSCQTDVVTGGDQILVDFFSRNVTAFAVAFGGALLKEFQDFLTWYSCLQTCVFKHGGLVSRRIVHVNLPFKNIINYYDTVSAPLAQASEHRNNMIAKRLSRTAALLVAVFALSGCNTASTLWNNPGEYLPNFLKPYRADVHQGNLVTSDMVTQLEKGMTTAQVQFLLGIPLVQDQFHPNRWDYVYYLLRGDDTRQLRRLTVFFNEEGRLDHWLSDAMPDEEQADQMILGTIDTFEPRDPKGEAKPESAE